MRKKILVIRFSSIGDIVLTSPVIRCLKLQLPNVEVHYLTKPAFKILLESNPFIDKIQILDKHPINKARELKKENYDLVIDLHNNLRTAQVKAVLGVQAYSFPKLNFEKFMLVNLKINLLPELHIVDRYLSTLENLGVYNDGLGLDYFIPENDKIAEINGFKPNQEPYIAWAIGAQHFTKRLPNEQIIALGKILNKKIVLLGGKEDFENGQLIQQAIGSNCLNLCGALNLNQSASLVQQCEKLYTNDTGLMHIGAAFKIPIVSFWGNTVPAFGMGPYYGNNPIPFSVIEEKDLSCRPCSKIGFKKCPKKHFNCMNQLAINSQNLASN